MADNPNGRTPRLKDIPKDLEAVNEQLQDMATKLDNLGSIPALRVNTEPYDKIERNLSSISVFSKKWADTLTKQYKTGKDIAKQLADQRKSIHRIAQDYQELEKKLKSQGKLNKDDAFRHKQLGRMLNDQKEKYRELKEQAKGIDGKWTAIAKLIGQDILDSFDKMGKSILALGLDSLVGTVNLIKKGFAAVYDLVDRSVHASGEFAMQLGAMSENMESLQKEGQELEGTMRALTGEGLGVGKRELAEAAKGFGFLDDKFKDLRQQSVLLGREFGIGSAAAGQLTRQFYLAGDSSKDLSKNYQDISDAANKAGVPVADFSKEILASSNFMASFGRKSRQVFLDSAKYAMRYGLSLKSLEGFTDLTDTFEGAANAAAKMNAIFGTSVNGLELMMENDPSKRLEMVRKALIGQGKSWDNLSRQERKFLAQTVNVSEEELQGLLSSKKSFGEFQKQKEKAAKDEATRQKMQQMALQRTAMTVLNLGQVYDQVVSTFKPVFDDLFGKDFFQKLPGRAQKVIGVFKQFIDVFRNNKAVQQFISKIREDFGALFQSLTSGKGSWDGINEAITKAVNFVSMFYDGIKKAGSVMMEWAPTILKVFGFLVDHADVILGLWAAFKIGGPIISGVNALLGLIGSGATVGSTLLGVLTGPVGLVAGVAALSVTLGYFIGKIKIVSEAVMGFFDIQEQVGRKLRTLFGFSTEDDDRENRRVANDKKYDDEIARGKANEAAGLNWQGTRRVRPAQVAVPAPSTNVPAGQSAAAATGANGNQVIKVDLHLDSQKVSSAIVKKGLSTQ